MIGREKDSQKALTKCESAEIISVIKLTVSNRC